MTRASVVVLEVGGRIVENFAHLAQLPPAHLEKMKHHLEFSLGEKFA